MPRYDYRCCNVTWEERVDYDLRDRVLCDVCNRPAKRLMHSISTPGLTYVGTKRFEGAELALGQKGLESAKDVERAMREVGAEPVDPYFRQKPLPPPKEVTLEELNPYLDGMPL